MRFAEPVRMKQPECTGKIIAYDVENSRDECDGIRTNSSLLGVEVAYADSKIAEACEIGAVEVVCIIVRGETGKGDHKWVWCLRCVNRSIEVCIAHYAAIVNRRYGVCCTCGRLPPADVKIAVFEGVGIPTHADTITS